MMTRRDMVTTGALGALAVGSGADVAVADEQSDGTMLTGLRELRSELAQIRSALDAGLRTNSLSYGVVLRVRTNFDQFLRAQQKFPDYCDIGTGVFHELYDWHVRNNQQIQVTRQAENRLAIRFMFTWMILRPEQETAYIGYPYDRG